MLRLVAPVLRRNFATMTTKPKLIAVVGATGTGKSEVSVYSLLYIFL